MSGKVRQAVVIVHGMGEQRPVETVLGFIDTALVPGPDGARTYYSRPDRTTGSYESRVFLAPRQLKDDDEADGDEYYAQTEFFEYHWSHLMQGNRLGDVLPTLLRLALLPFRRVPFGLLWIWGLSWATILFGAWAFVWGPWSGSRFVADGDAVKVAQFVGSGGVLTLLGSFVLTKVLPVWVTRSFVDVVRYLDTSPRSYAVRREIRKGFVELLEALQTSDRDFDRIVIVAHSLGAFIAYDGITHLWGAVDRPHARADDDDSLAALREVERSAGTLDKPSFEHSLQPPLDSEELAEYQAGQSRLWMQLQQHGPPWLISDFVSVGTPMYFADRLMRGSDRRSFPEQVKRREMSTCPPQPDPPASPRAAASSPDGEAPDAPFYSWRSDRRVLHEGAAFAVVRWTNLYFPARGAFFGDWFGGPLTHLFGHGIRDVMVTGNGPSGVGASWKRNRLVPGLAHAMYFRFPDDNAPDAIATQLRGAMDLDSTPWLRGDAVRDAASA